MKLVEISVEVDGEAAEAVSAVFNRYGQGGAVIEEVYPVDMSLPPGASAPVLRVKTFLPVEPTLCGPLDSAALRSIEEALWHLGQIYPIPSPTVRWLSEADWAAAWKAGYKVQRIGRRILIKASWQTLRGSKAEPLGSPLQRVVIELDPGMAFGTGLHPSTRLCLQALERHVWPGQRVLDVGTGSGILSIAAAKLGAGSVVAMDIDELALDVARENIARNGVQASVSWTKASLTPVTASAWPTLSSPAERDANGPVPVFNADGAWDEAFDLVVMNILAEVIVDSAPAMAKCLAPGGLFIVSGILGSKEDWVQQALAAAGLKVTERRVRRDWVALIGRKEYRQNDAAAVP